MFRYYHNSLKKIVKVILHNRLITAPIEKIPYLNMTFYNIKIYCLFIFKYETFLTKKMGIIYPQLDYYNFYILFYIRNYYMISFLNPLLTSVDLLAIVFWQYIYFLLNTEKIKTHLQK